MEQGQVYGQSTKDWFLRYDLDTSSWKTSQLSFLEGLDEFSETFPQLGMMRNGKLYRRQTMAQNTKEKDYLSLPTPRASDGIRWTYNKKIDVQKSISKVVLRSGDYALTYLWLWNQISVTQAVELTEMMMGFPVGWTVLDA